MKKIQTIDVQGNKLLAEVMYKDKNFVVFNCGEKYFIRALATGRFLIADKTYAAFDGYRFLPDGSLIVNLHEDSLVVRPGQGYFIKNPVGVEMKLRNVKHSQNKGQRGCAIVGTFLNHRNHHRKIVIQAGQNKVWEGKTKKWTFPNANFKDGRIEIKPLHKKGYVFYIPLSPF